MADSPRPVLVSRHDPGEDRLDSWKQIAAYLGREVRTVQGWEKSEGLPVHRHQHSRQGSVYAFRAELSAWREARKESPESAAPAVGTTVDSSRASRRRPWLLGSVGVGVAALLVTGLAWAGFLSRGRSAGGSGVEPLSSVAVLAFLDLSPQKDQEYFSDGLTEEIIDALSRVPNLRVAARTSAFAFKDKPTDIRQIGQELNVSAVLEGSVRKSGDELRITAQLNRVADGYHLWSQTYDRRMSDIFAVQRELSETIANQLRAGAVPDRKTTTNVEAYRLYQEGHYLFNQHHVPDSYLKAIDRYQQAIQLDPTYASAYAGLAEAEAYLAEQFVVPPRETMPKARQAAEKAIALDDGSADAHTSLGLVKLDYEWDVDGAQREFERAMELNPNSGYIRHWYGHSFEAKNRLDDAIREMRAALTLDPLQVVLTWDIASELVAANRSDEALRHLVRADEVFPGVPQTAFFRVSAYHRKGDLQSARKVLDELKSKQPNLFDDPMFIALSGVQAAREGHLDEAARMLAKVEDLRRTQYVDAVLVLELCAVSKNRAQLLIWLQRAYEERSTLFIYLPLHPEWYAGDPEAEAIVAKAH